MDKKTLYLRYENYNWKQFEYESIEDLKSEFNSRNISIGYRASIGNGASIGYGASIGDRASIGAHREHAAEVGDLNLVVDGVCAGAGRGQVDCGSAAG